MEDASGNWIHMLQDGLGSVHAEVNSSGAVVAIQTYTPYGDPINATGSFASPFEFTGEQTDSTGQIYLRARYYAPGMGVFTARDPYEGTPARPMSLNGYSWVEGQVVNRVDPSGMQSLPSGFKCFEVPEGKVCPPGYYTRYNSTFSMCEALDGSGDVLLPRVAWENYWLEHGCEDHPYLFIPIPGLDGYVEGANVGFTALGENLQAGIEVVYNLKTFQRISWFYSNDLSDDIIMSETDAFYTSFLGGSAAPYVGHITGFKPSASNDVPPNSLGHFSQYRNQYSGRFIYGTVDVGTPLVDLGFGGVYFSSPNESPEPVWGITAFLTAGVGLQPPISGGYGRLWYTEIQNTSKTHIQSDCKVNSEKLVRDIMIGEGSPLALAAIPLSPAVAPARAVAAAQAAINADRHNFFVDATSCSCGS